jgi:hypothetical protein
MHQALMAFKLLILMLMIPSAGVFGQASNPFDLRKSQIESGASPSEDQNKSDSVVFSNPFDLRPAFADESPEVTESGMRDWVHKVLNSPADPTEIRNFLFWLLLFLTFMLAIALNLNRGFVSRLFRSNFNLNLASVLYREAREENNVIIFILYGLYFAGIAIFLFLGVQLFHGPLHYFYLLYITLFITGIYVIRHLSIRLLSYIFGFQREAERYLFNIVSFGSIFSILLIPADFVMAFTSPDIARRFLYGLAILFVLAYLFRQAKEILLASNLWQNSLIHFLLYLCSFEIAPYLLLYGFIDRTT